MIPSGTPRAKPVVRFSGDGHFFNLPAFMAGATAGVTEKARKGGEKPNGVRYPC